MKLHHACLFVFAVSAFAQFDVLDVRAAEEAKSQSLFNGRDLSGWHADVPELDDNPQGKSPFIVRDGLLVSLESVTNLRFAS